MENKRSTKELTYRLEACTRMFNRLQNQIIDEKKDILKEVHEQGLFTKEFEALTKLEHERLVLYDYITELKEKLKG